MIALMPVTCEKIHNTIPINKDLRTPGLRISAKEDFSTEREFFISFNSSSAFSEPFILVRMLPASSHLAFCESHLGLSGTKKRRIKNITEGIAPDPNIHRHPVDIF